MIAESNYVLRYEKGQFKSGYCLLREQNIMIINKFYSTEGKINVLLDILKTIELDTTKFSEKSRSLYEELFKVKKTIFNTNHDIKIFGYEVELYVQNATEAHFSSGVYSVIYDEWDVKPEKEDSNIDTKILKSKINHWKSQIDTVVDNATEKDIDEAREYIKKFKEKLKKYRSSGLKKEGEYSYENLVFKYLRRSDYLEKLFNLENNLLDKELSLMEQNVDFLLNLKKS
jgi:hypothetical protein